MKKAVLKTTDSNRRFSVARGSKFVHFDVTGSTWRKGKRVETILRCALTPDEALELSEMLRNAVLRDDPSAPPTCPNCGTTSERHDEIMGRSFTCGAGEGCECTWAEDR